MTAKSGAVKRSEPAAASSGKAPPKPAAALRARVGGEDAGFDRLIYERVRLGIMSALAMNERLSFNELKSLFDVSDGNLSAQARRGGLRGVHEVLRGPKTEVPVPHHTGRQKGIAALPRAHRGRHQGNPAHLTSCTSR